MKKSNTTLSQQSKKPISGKVMINVLLYQARKNHLIEEGKFCISSRAGNTVYTDEYLELACEKSGTSRSVMEGCLQDFMTVGMKILQRGDAFTTPYLKGRPYANGVLDKKTEPFKPTEHGDHGIRLSVNFSQMLVNKFNASDVPVKHDTQIIAKPNMQEVIDYYSKETDTFVLGNPAVIKGVNFDLENADEVILYLEADDDSRIELTEYHTTSSNSIDVKIPEDIPIGSYKLKLSTLADGEFKEDTHFRAIKVKAE